MLEEERRLGIEEGIKQGIAKGIEQGISEGIDKGRKEQQISIARNLKNSGLDLELISQNTGLSIE